MNVQFKQKVLVQLIRQIFAPTLLLSGVATLSFAQTEQSLQHRATSLAAQQSSDTQVTAIITGNATASTTENTTLNASNVTQSANISPSLSNQTTNNQTTSNQTTNSSTTNHSQSNVSNPLAHLSLNQQVQIILKQQPIQQNLSFDDLESYNFSPADTAMLNEIYQIAEQAKKDAEVWEQTGERVDNNQILIDQQTRVQMANGTQANTVDISSQATLHNTTTVASNASMNITQASNTSSNATTDIEKIDVANLSSPVNVSALIEEIQKDSQIVVEQVQQAEQQPSDSEQSSQTANNSSKSTWLSRWKERRNNSSKVSKIKYINVVVGGTQDVSLIENLKAKLSTITAESLAEDFQSLLPQMRTLANQAAQAVGYYDVVFAFQSVGNDSINVVVSQAEPVIVKSQNIEFSGDGEYLPQFQIVNVIPDLEEGKVLNQGLYEKTKERILEAASSNGFFDGHWKMRDVKVELPQNTAEINLKYDTGERYRLGDVTFKMSDESQPLILNESVLRAMIPWQKGDDYTTWRVNMLGNHLSNSRYFSSLSINAITPDPIEKELDLPADVLAVIEKNKAAIQQTAPVESNGTQVDESQFAQEVSPISDEFVDNNAEYQQEQKELDALQEQARKSKEIPVVVTLSADKLNNLETGIGYGTDTGVRLRSQYRRTIVNRFGHGFQGNLELSRIRQALDGRYSIPHPHPINRYISLLGGYERESDFSVGQGMSLVSESAVAGAEYVMRSNRFDAWQHDVGLRYRLDRLTVNGDVDPQDIPQEFFIVQGSGTQQSLLMSYKASKLYADSPTNPTQGFRHQYKVELGSKAVLNDVDLAILTAGMSFIYSFGENKNHQFVGRADGSYMFTNDFARVPYNLRFFTGGDQSIRGFDYKSLSPSKLGLKIGGQALAIGSLEYNYQVKEGWRVGLFSDFGNSFDAKFSNPLAYSVGLGVRWLSPVGTIRVDLATGLSDENKPIRLHFFIGPQL
ncbi:MAG: BamA/TamA family outer membrane protein [Acinetobacter sp.]|nr:BamA/TamA family outer membrane protein [Acinetobacter sp.]